MSLARITRLFVAEYLAPQWAGQHGRLERALSRLWLLMRILLITTLLVTGVASQSSASQMGPSYAPLQGDRNVCTELIALGQAGSGYTQFIHAQLGPRPPKAPLRNLEIRFARAEVRVVRSLATKPPQPIRDALRQLARAYEMAARGNTALYESHDIKRDGEEIAQYVTRYCAV